MSDIKDLKNKLEEVSEEVAEINSNLSTTNALLSEHFRQDERFYTDIRELKEGQAETNKHLSEYNTQLQVHIAGVLELRRSNELLQKKIEQEAVEINTRLEIAELPIKWAIQTSKIVKWITALASGIGALVLLGKIISGAVQFSDIIKLLGL